MQKATKLTPTQKLKAEIVALKTQINKQAQTIRKYQEGKAQ